MTSTDILQGRKIAIGEDIFDLCVPIKIGKGCPPTITANVPGLARTSECGRVIFEPDYLPESGAALDIDQNDSEGWHIPGVIMRNYSNGKEIMK